MEPVEAESIGEVVDELDGADKTEFGPILLTGIGQAEPRTVGCIHPEAVRAQEGDHEAPARRAGRALDAAVQ